MQPQRVIAIWKDIFDQCYERLSDQNLPCLRKSIFEYVISDEPYKTSFYKNHHKELAAIEAFRRCYRRNMLIYSQQASENKSLIVDIILAENNSILENMAESWIPGLRLSALNSLSGEVYENAHTSGQTIVIFPDNVEAVSNITAFHKNNHLPLESNLGHAIRKQLSTCGEKSALAVAWEGDEYKTQGLVPLDMKRNYPSIRFVNHLHWELHLPTVRLDQKVNEHSDTCCLIRFCKGSLRFPLLDISEEYRLITEKVFNNKDVAETIATLLKNVDAKKGTSLVFSTPEAIKAESLRLARENHRGVPFSGDTCYPLLDSNGVNEDLLKQLSNIDGALLVDTSGCCYAFGVILDGLAVKGNPNRGARYNSMPSYKKTFSEKHPNVPFLCVVFSEDGMVDFF